MFRGSKIAKIALAVALLQQIFFLSVSPTIKINRNGSGMPLTEHASKNNAIHNTAKVNLSSSSLLPLSLKSLSSVFKEQEENAVVVRTGANVSIVPNTVRDHHAKNTTSIMAISRAREYQKASFPAAGTLHISSPATSFYFTTAQECLLSLEQVQNQNMDVCFEHHVPTLESVITFNGYHHILLGTIRHIGQTLRDSEWNCGPKYQTRRLPWRGETMIKCPTHLNVTHIWPSEASNKSGLVPKYDNRLHIACETLETNEFKEQEKHLGEKVKLGACQIFRGPKSRTYMHEWITYHHLLGIQHFWIFMNERWNLEGLPQLPHITYVPYNFYMGDHILGANISRFRVIDWQVPMQMRCLWKAKKYGLDWIITTDSDEYIDIQDPTATAMETIIAPAASSSAAPALTTTTTSMRKFLSRFDPQKVGALQMMNIPYGSHLNLERKEDLPLQLDQVWRNKDMRSVEGGWERQKLIYSVSTAISVGVHYLWNVSNGGNAQEYIELLEQPETSVYLHHYKSARSPTRIRGTRLFEDLVMDSNLRDRYRTQLLTVMNRTDLIRPSHDGNLSKQ